MSPIAWEKVTTEELGWIEKIVNRATEHLDNVDRLSLHMDVSAVHVSGCPLKLKELYEADNFNFLHDVCGIMKHLDRKTGKLKNCFVPRYFDSNATDTP